MFDQARSLHSKKHTPWSRVKKLVLIGVQYLAKSPILLKALPDWIALFPALEEVQLCWEMFRFSRSSELNPKLASIADSLSSPFPNIRIVVQ
ncbi:hypothetical protein AN958_00281 [Leucoagaricus sp. SymC.cos]|nr:hypothetical protein AN958_00281 [Leucoagaricus sp. SymC.cos]